MVARFQERVKELVDVDGLNTWSAFKNVILNTCDEVRGKKKGRRNHGGDTWCRNKGGGEGSNTTKESGI